MTTEQLQPWCSEDITRIQICTPYRDGEWVIATNGRILIRVPWVESVHGDIRTDGPNTKTTFRGTEKAHIPTLPEPGWESVEDEIKSCTACHGIGSWKECKTCDGHCEVTCDQCGHSHQCEECKGVGYIKGPGDTQCDECCGKGTLTEWKRIKLTRPGGCAPLLIFSHYLRLIMALPNVKIFTHLVLGNIPHRFTFDGGDGIFREIRS